MINTTINCDQCGKTAETDSQYPHEWMIEMKAVDVRESNSCGITFAVLVEPSIKKTLHFCDLDCLKKFLR